MERDDPIKLTRRERQIMDAVYRLGKATAAEIRAQLPDPPTTTAVRTLLGILEIKGQVTHISDGIRFIYRAVTPREEMAQTALDRTLQTFFGGSLEKAVAAYLAERDDDEKKEDLEKIAALIRQARQEGR